MISEIRALFDEWIAAVARAVNFGIGRYARRRQILLSEYSDTDVHGEADIGAKGSGYCRKFRFVSRMASPIRPCRRIGTRRFAAVALKRR